MLNISVSFSTYRPSSFNHFVPSDRMKASTAADQVVPYQQCFLCHEQTSYTKRVLLVS